jgi:hypothetical protein
MAIAALFNPRFVCGQQTQSQALSNSGLSLSEESAIRPGSIISGYVSPPKYTVSRYDEDYSFLANPANRTEALDSIKYIPLFGREPDYFLTLGGEVREQYEYILNDNFGVGTKNSARTFGTEEMDRILQVEHFDKCREIVGVGVQVVAVPAPRARRHRTPGWRPRRLPAGWALTRCQRPRTS